MNQRLISKVGTVTDTLLKLEWGLCTQVTVSWDDAVKMQGVNGWRLPTLGELRMFWEACESQPDMSIETRLCWSSSRYTIWGTWCINFQNGNVLHLGHHHSCAVKLVRNI
jgi:hypothetical protein